MRPTTAVILPGSGSDDVFVRSAFAGPLGAFGITLSAVAPRRGGDVTAGYRDALDAALDGARDREERLLVGGISLGAHVAARWAAQSGTQSGAQSGAQQSDGPLVGLLLALPAWSGPPGGAPAAHAARITAGLVRAGGVAAAVAAAREGAPSWLHTELARAWSGYGDGLAAALDAAAAEPGPDRTALGTIAVPTGVAALVDDPVHPIGVAQEWCAALPRAVLHAATLAAFGADPQVIGRAALLGWLRARG